jgi:hypothetical protein
MNNRFVQGEYIFLRELQESDLEGDWYKWFNDPEVTIFQNKGIFPNSREKQRHYYDFLTQNNNEVVFAIVEESSNKHIGNVGLHKMIGFIGQQNLGL